MQNSSKISCVSCSLSLKNNDESDQVSFCFVQLSSYLTLCSSYFLKIQQKRMNKNSMLMILKLPIAFSISVPFSVIITWGFSKLISYSIIMFWIWNFSCLRPKTFHQSKQQNDLFHHQSIGLSNLVRSSSCFYISKSLTTR